jgi:hypothetical protein
MNPKMGADGLVVDGEWVIRARYYDWPTKTWKEDDKDWEMDANGTEMVLKVGDNVIAFFSQQRQAFIPVGGGPVEVRSFILRSDLAIGGFAVAQWVEFKTVGDFCTSGTGEWVGDDGAWTGDCEWTGTSGSTSGTWTGTSNSYSGTGTSSFDGSGTGTWTCEDGTGGTWTWTGTWAGTWTYASGSWIGSGTWTGTWTRDPCIVNKQLCWKRNDDGDPVYFWVFDRQNEFYGTKDHGAGECWIRPDTPSAANECLNVEDYTPAVNDPRLWEAFRMTCDDFTGSPCDGEDEPAGCS